MFCRCISYAYAYVLYYIENWKSQILKIAKTNTFSSKIFESVQKHNVGEVLLFEKTRIFEA